MKKKVLGILLSTVMCASMLAGCGGGTAKETATVEAVDTSAVDAVKEKYGEDVFAANTDYDYYTVIEYTIESANATFAATISKKSDNSEYYIQCLFYGDEQEVIWDGEKVVKDKTGFMETDTPAMVEAAEAQGVWIATK